MTKKLLFLLFVLVALVGCGGGGGGGSSTPSPFAGSWAGTWASNDQNGTANITIANSGNATGSITNLTIDETASLTGKVQSDGDITVRYTYPGFQEINGAGTVALSNGGNTLSGTIVGTVGGNSESSDFVLTRQ